MEPRISIITLGTRDMAQSVAFYRDGLGWETDYKPSDGIAFFKLPGTWLGIYPWDALAEDAKLTPHEIKFGGITLAHNVRSKKEADSVFQQAIDAGAKELKMPVTTPKIGEPVILGNTTFPTETWWLNYNFRMKTNATN